MYTKFGERRRMKSVELIRYGAEDIEPTDSLAILTHAVVRGRGVEWPSREA
jgi:hypothetical protein